MVETFFDNVLLEHGSFPCCPPEQLEGVILTLKEEQLPFVQPVSPLNEKITKPRFLIKLAKSLTGISL